MTGPAAWHEAENPGQSTAFRIDPPRSAWPLCAGRPDSLAIQAVEGSG